MNEIIYVYGVIYKITNLVNNKIYIGQTIGSIEERFKGHVRQAEKFNHKDQMLIARAIKKYGKNNFKIEVLHSSHSKEDLNFKEKLCIRIYNSFAKNGYGYNVAEGGNFGNAYEGKTKEELKEISEKQSKNHKGRIIINNGKNYISVKKEFLEKHLSEGWSLGKGNTVCEESMNSFKLKNGIKHKNTVWINNGFERKKVKKSELENFLNDGFFKGVLNTERRWMQKDGFEILISNCFVDDYLKDGFVLGRVSGRLKNRITINNGFKNKTIIEEDLNGFLKDGWNVGGIKHGRGRLRTIHRDNEQRQVPLNEVEKHLNDGWFVGMKKQKEREKSKKAVHKNEDFKFVKESDVDYYLSLGYELGKPESKIRKVGSFTHSDEVKNRIRQKIKNKTWLNNGIKNKYINKDDFEIYISQGWISGKKQKSKQI